MNFKNLILLATFSILLIPVCLAQTNREKGIEFLEKNDFNKALEFLNKAVEDNKKDVFSLYNLGLTYEKLNQIDNAIKSYENSIIVCEELINNNIDEQMDLIVLGQDGDSLKNFIKKITIDLEAGYLSILKFSNLNEKEAKSKKWQKKFTLIESLAPNSEIAKSFGSGKPTTSVKITSRAFPQARGNGVVRFRVLFLSNGKIGAIIPLNFLTKETNEASMRAVMNTKFTPANEDGKPISSWKVIEYSFRTY